MSTGATGLRPSGCRFAVDRRFCEFRDLVDYNNDGFLDLFEACGDDSPALNLLYRNSLTQHGNTNHWLEVRLKGTVSNASAIGARHLGAGATNRPERKCGRSGDYLVLLRQCFHGRIHRSFRFGRRHLG